MEILQLDGDFPITSNPLYIDGEEIHYMYNTTPNFITVFSTKDYTNQYVII